VSFDLIVILHVDL